MAAQPEVNDQFWFDRSKDAIQNAPSQISDAGSKIATTLIWLWGAYTAAISIGAAINSKFDVPFVTGIILVLPIPLLLLGYFFANWAQVCKLVEFDPRSPTEIQQAYDRSLHIRTRRLNIAIGLAVTSAALVAIAIALASLSKPTRQFAIHGILQPQRHGADMLLLTGHFPANTSIMFRFIALDEDGWNHVSDWTRVSNVSFMSSDSGDVQVTVPLNHNPAGYHVIAEWTAGGPSASTASTVK